MNVGIDLVEIPRIEKCIQREGFLKRFFSKEENELFATKKNPAETVAGRFCVKEAFSKALGTGVRDFSLDEITTLNDELGAPYIKLTGKAAELLGKRRLSVSITHTKQYASAVVIIYD